MSGKNVQKVTGRQNPSDCVAQGQYQKDEIIIKTTRQKLLAGTVHVCCT